MKINKWGESQLSLVSQRIFDWLPRRLFLRLSALALVTFLLVNAIHLATAQSVIKPSRSQVVLISLDGATPRIIDDYLAKGVLNRRTGLGLLQSRGVSAQRNLTCNPSLTAACHTTLNSGSTTARHDVVANSFHLVASPFKQNVSGFAAPIGGYAIEATGATQSATPTAEPIWIKLRQHGKKVVAATFPGADGADIRLSSAADSPIVQPAQLRTVDYTVPFGGFAGLSAKGFSLSAGDFSAAPTQTKDQLTAAGKTFYSPVLQKTNGLEQFTVGAVSYDLQVAALDTSNDRQVNYDTLVFFDAKSGIRSGGSLPSTGSAFVKAKRKKSSLFYLEGSSNKAGTAFYVSNLAPDLSTVHLVRYSANSIPRNSAVLADVDDINQTVGFWAPQPDFRIPQRSTPGLTDFSDLELENIYEDQVRTFVDYQTRVALRAIAKNPDADLVMLYIEQPDGSEHQFLAIDSRQATNPADANTIGSGQDSAKIARYETYVQTAYKTANRAVQKIIDAVGTTRGGVPRRNIIVVSDHGFSPFHTAVNLNAFLTNKGVDMTKVRAITSGPAVNVYINLQGREPDGTVSRSEYILLQQQVLKALKELADSNPNYSKQNKRVFDQIYPRPRPSGLSDPTFGLGTNEFIAQDSGDVFATLKEGYNFDGAQTPLVPRVGDDAAASVVFSVPSFYGAHGYDPEKPNMSAIFFAAGPDIDRRTFKQVRNIDVVPTINRLLRVESASTVQGTALKLKS
ncbi:phosphodiesterase [Phormidesmis priestleyi ULC007]|uniref:Phosphodiesterase n=1 Tax=Phormidesmis priestleyi ULC007 TaxID=1920490 RepID=A0A2T1D3W8_9CYAN|nr:alkaline phosphatase family protein [Phormidesmis priestleyi]PSB15136.1 phosphodiesterase [Phormidesmis priestleyi ULC007]PZO45902.1 MAG: phosphodiesterase [Phormidesmis priestleyi]